MLESLAKISTVVTPILILLFAGIGWMVRQTIERKNKLEYDLRSDRIKIYNEVVYPFILMFSNENITSLDKKNKNVDFSDMGVKRILTIEYRENIFKMLLFGSDGVVKSYNNLMQHLFHADHNDPNKAKENTAIGLRLLGQLLLEIRKSTGNELTNLTNIQMLESIITDIRHI